MNRIVAFMVAITLVASVFVGCSDSKDGETDITNTPDNQTEMVDGVNNTPDETNDSTQDNGATENNGTTNNPANTDASNDSTDESGITKTENGLGIDTKNLPELDPFRLPVLTGSTIELAFGLIPRNLEKIKSTKGIDVFTYVNLQQELKRFGFDESSPKERWTETAGMVAPIFMRQHIGKSEKAIDNPANWSWIIQDLGTQGYWFAGNLELDKGLMQRINEDRYQKIPLPKSNMMSYLAPEESMSPVYGRFVMPFAQDFAYFNMFEANTTQADDTAYNIVTKGEGLAKNPTIAALFTLIHEAENVALIHNRVSITDAKSLFAPMMQDPGMEELYDGLADMGRSPDLEWIAICHHPSLDRPIRFVLGYASGTNAKNDMRLLSAIWKNEKVGETLFWMNEFGLTDASFSTSGNIGVIECSTRTGLPIPEIASQIGMMFYSGFAPIFFHR
ncbi:MAG TPA: hypothetical protein PKV16_05455 [Caldisericia bacterium]|nr:hypothetical protein [Caldisericia bacterium]HPF48758.1 hypothetical protein [Caldisericia bacterium]HPI83582.1 hypothetical protein [Caldisericia bacterium]HPQ93213.1 hypothetical protein [Caldisericia bacterium]HRV74954.1 hypothetical protein [Caldisericia bacterium]